MAFLRRASNQNKTFGAEWTVVGKDPETGKTVRLLIRPATERRTRELREKYGVEENVTTTVKAAAADGVVKDQIVSIRQRILSTEDLRRFRRDMAQEWTADAEAFTVRPEDQESVDLFKKLAPAVDWQVGVSSDIAGAMTPELAFNLFENDHALAETVCSFSITLGRKVYGTAEATLQKN